MLRSDTIAAELFAKLIALIEYERTLAAMREQSKVGAELEARDERPVENSAPVEYKCKWKVIE